MSVKLVKWLLWTVSTAIVLSGLALIVLSITFMERMLGLPTDLAVAFFNVGFWVLIFGLAFCHQLMK